MRLRGFDASCVQGLIPAAELAADGHRFGILKGYEGNRTLAHGGLDPCLERNVTACLEHGIEPFVYLFAYPLPTDGKNANRAPKDQAKLHADSILRYPELATRPPFADLEWPAPHEWAKWGCSAKQINNWCREYIEALADLIGVRPVLYTYPHWWQSLIADGADVSWAAEYGLWLASYPERGRWPLDSEEPLTMPKPWTSWLFWQFDGDGAMRFPNGVDADFCVFNGDEETLQRFVGRSVVTPEQSFSEAAIVHPRAPLPERD